MELQKNIHIQLFDPEGRITSERLVKQDPEFNLGPKETHDGPLRISLTLMESSDVEKAIVYLNKLSGKLPLSAPAKPRGRIAGSTTVTDIDENRYETLLTEALSAHPDNQDKFITFLRELGYIFVTGDFLKFIIPETYEIKERYLKEYQFLVKKTKEAKDPRNDKFDPVLIFGIRIIEVRYERVLFFMNGKLHSKARIPVPEKKPMTAKGTNLLRYPDYMTEEERFKFGNEHRMLFRDENRKPSKFYLRWYKDVRVGDELKFDVSLRIADTV